MRLLERESAGKLEVERELGAAVDRDDRDVVHLAHARDVERRGVRALAHVGVGGLDRLDVDDDVRLRQRRLHRALDRVGRRVALPDGRVVVDADHDVREHAPRRLPHPQPPQLHRRLDADDRLPRRLLRVRRGAIHQHVDVAPHQPGRREQDERRRRRAPRPSRRPGWPARTSSRPTSTATEPPRSLPKWSAFDASAGLEYARAARHDAVVRATSMQMTMPDDEERVPGRVHGRAAVDEPRDRVPDDEDAGDDEDRALGERGEMLGLPVAVLVARVGGAHGDADGEERQQRGDEIRARVRPPPRRGRGCGSRGRCRA